MKLLKTDPLPLLRKVCAEALPRISEPEDDDSTLPALIDGLKDPSLEVRAGCAVAYGVGDRAKSAAALAHEMLKAQPKDENVEDDCEKRIETCDDS